MKTKGKLLILILSMLFLTGCWDTRELNEMLIVSGVAIDKTDNGKILLTLICFVPPTFGESIKSIGPNQSNKSIIISEEGENIMDAYKKIEKKSSREIFLAQLDCVIIGEKLAREGVSGVLDFFSRHREPSLRIYILFTKGKVTDILKTNSPLEKNPVEQIRKLQNSNVGIKMRLKDFFYTLTEEGIQPVAPVLNRDYLEKKNKSDNAQIFSINSAAVFSDDKLVGWINDKEVSSILWIQNKMKKGVITVNIPNEKGGGKISGQIIRSKTKINPIIYHDEVKMKLDINTEASIDESSSKLDLSNPDTVHYVEECYAEDIKRSIQTSIESVQKQFNVDIFGFGSIIYGKYPEQWEKNYRKCWNKNFSELNTKISCSVKIYGTGFNTKSLTIEN